jgi:hypothetical protein
MAQMRKKAPRRSISSIFPFSVSLLSSRLGDSKKNQTAAIAIPPNGKLIYSTSVLLLCVKIHEDLTQKHHLQVNLSVNAPPKRGPTTDDIPNILERAAIYIGRFLKGTVKPTIVMPPEKMADAPAPATALPTMSIVESVAAAQRTDPTSNSTRAKT